MATSLRILHLDTEKSWRGGENQVRLLIDGLRNQVAFQAGAVPEKSVTFQNKKWNCELLGLASSSPMDPRNIYRLVKFCRQNKIQLIDAHAAGAHSLALAAMRFMPEMKLVVHRRVDNRPKNALLTRRKYCSNRVAGFVAISNAIKDILEEYGIPAEKVQVVRSAMSVEPFADLNHLECQAQLRHRLRLDTATILIGNASALSEQKGYEVLIEAVSLLKKKSLPFHLVIAGTGKLEAALKYQVKQEGLEKHVSFLGFIENVPQFLAGLDILAVPSRWEGLGTILLEGALAGSTLVGTRVGGIPEVIQDHQTGLLVEKENAVALAQALEKLILDPDFRLKLSQRAKLRVSTEFSTEQMVSGNLKIYQHVLA